MLRSLTLLALLAASCGHTRAPSSGSGAEPGASGAPGAGSRASGQTAQPAPPVDPRAEARASWPGNCGDLKRALDPARAALKAAPLPSRSAPADPWALRFGELHASLPAERYTLTVRVSPRSVSAMLIAPALSVALIEDPPGAPISDLFAHVGAQRNPASEQLTRELFGKAPTLYELLRQGYAHGLDDLSCDAAQMVREIPIAIGIVLKTTGAWADAVYGAPFGLPGFTFSGRQQRHCVVETQVFGDDATRIVSYRAARTPSCRQRLARFTLTSAAASTPRWLTLLGAALARPREAGPWQALLAELRQSQAPAASISSVERVLAQLAGR